MYHQAGEQSIFEAQYPVTFWGTEYKPGDQITIGLTRNWDDQDEGLGSGGPWGWGGYPSRLLAELAGDPDLAKEHTHTCLDCDREIAFGAFDCEQDADHDFARCDECAGRAEREAQAEALLDQAESEQIDGCARWAVLPTAECVAVAAPDLPYQLGEWNHATARYHAVWGLQRELPLREALADFDYLSDSYGQVDA